MYKSLSKVANKSRSIRPAPTKEELYFLFLECLYQNSRKAENTKSQDWLLDIETIRLQFKTDPFASRAYIHIFLNNGQSAFPRRSAYTSANHSCILKIYFCEPYGYLDVIERITESSFDKPFPRCPNSFEHWASLVLSTLPFLTLLAWRDFHQR